MSIFIVVLSAVLIVPPVLFRIWRHFWLETHGLVRACNFDFKRSPDAKKAVRIFKVKYEYQVGQQIFNGSDSVEVDVPYYEEKDAMSALSAQFKSGDVITVYYPEHMPQVSALKRSIGLDKILAAVGVIIIVAIGGHLYSTGIDDTWESQKLREPAHLAPDP